MPLAQHLPLCVVDRMLYNIKSRRHYGGVLITEIHSVSMPGSMSDTKTRGRKVRRPVGVSELDRNHELKIQNL
jgi:hypothetical protein